MNFIWSQYRILEHHLGFSYWATVIFDLYQILILHRQCEINFFLKSAFLLAKAMCYCSIQLLTLLFNDNFGIIDYRLKFWLLTKLCCCNFMTDKLIFKKSITSYFKNFIYELCFTGFNVFVKDKIHYSNGDTVTRWVNYWSADTFSLVRDQFTTRLRALGILTSSSREHRWLSIVSTSAVDKQN